MAHISTAYPREYSNGYPGNVVQVLQVSHLLVNTTHLSLASTRLVIRGACYVSGDESVLTVPDRRFLEPIVMTLNDIVSSIENKISDADFEECAAIIGAVERVKALAYGKMMNRTPIPPIQGDRLLTVAEAAEKLCMTEDYLYRTAKKLPFTVRTGRKQLRFSLAGIERYIKQRLVSA
jgi:predicted DNA-binding transcriptional regulator AlpA